MKDYQKLKQIIQEANPEIMELGFGCEVEGFSEALGRTFFLDKYEDEKEEWIAVYAENWIDYTDRPIYSARAVKPAKLPKYKILGRPIRLAGVLLAIGDVKIKQKITDTDSVDYGKEVDITDEIKQQLVIEYWNLKDNNLDHQKTETKQFLIDLLVK